MRKFDGFTNIGFQHTYASVNFLNIESEMRCMDFLSVIVNLLLCFGNAYPSPTINSLESSFSLRLTGKYRVPEVLKVFSKVQGVAKIEFGDRPGESWIICLNAEIAMGMLIWFEKSGWRLECDPIHRPSSSGRLGFAGQPMSGVVVNNWPRGLTRDDIAFILQEYEGFEGFVNVQEGVAAFYRGVEWARRVVEGIGGMTNLTTVFLRPNGSSIIGNNTITMSGEDNDIAYGPKTTVQLTNVHMDRADLRRFARQLPGFVKLAFYRDWSFLCFDTVASASSAVSQINSSSTMRAAFTKVEYNPKSSLQSLGPVNSTLYVNNLPFNALNTEFTKIFGEYDGFMDVYFFRGSCKVYFVDIARATQALEDLNATTNLVATYFNKDVKNTAGSTTQLPNSDSAGALDGVTANPTTTSSNFTATSTSAEKQNDDPQVDHEQSTINLDIQGSIEINDDAIPSSATDIDGSSNESSTSDPALTQKMESPEIVRPRSTIHVTGICVDKGDLKLLFDSYEGFVKIAFYRDWCFCVFKSTETASIAIERLLSETKMKASFAKDEYTPNYTIPDVGPLNSVLYIFNLPWDATNLELTKVNKKEKSINSVYS